MLKNIKIKIIMKKLVKHGDTIQYKYVITNQNDLLEYCSTILAKRYANQIVHDESGKMKQMANVLQKSPIELGGFLTQTIYQNCSKSIDEGKVIVFNQGGGYCFWSDDNMKLLDWKYLHEPCDTIVLENAEIVEKDVKDYLWNNGIKEYLELTNLYEYSSDEILYYCGKAKSIVFMTQFVEKERIINLLKLASNLEQKEIIIINSPNFPSDSKYLSKHIVKIIETDE